MNKSDFFKSLVIFFFAGLMAGLLSLVFGSFFLRENFLFLIGLVVFEELIKLGMLWLVVDIFSQDRKTIYGSAPFFALGFVFFESAIIVMGKGFLAEGDCFFLLGPALIHLLTVFLLALAVVEGKRTKTVFFLFILLALLLHWGYNGLIFLGYL